MHLLQAFEELDKLDIDPSSVVLTASLVYDKAKNCTEEELSAFRNMGWPVGTDISIPKGTKLTFDFYWDTGDDIIDYYLINDSDDVVGFSRKSHPASKTVLKNIDKTVKEAFCEKRPSVCNKLTKNESVAELHPKSIKTGNKETIKMNLKKVFEELDHLYESDKPVDEPVDDIVDEDTEIEIVDDESDDAVETEESNQVVLECANCGSLSLVDNADITIDEESELVNVDETCKNCEEAKGYKILGTLMPYSEEEELEEFLDLSPSVNLNLDGGTGNNVSVLSTVPGM